ncbi:hypothetical protein NM961_12575 [Tahibacter sp. P2K]|uniref:Uncharacterized protein n=2 Tax=Tahibacter harae TaxID=2963937 RepID=A0ABT1QTD0_9GAMM|nr:hypothetical protein [Tahibacter harae]MCQ4165545.1 hypothetical protein [Tahibacter harae]
MGQHGCLDLAAACRAIDDAARMDSVQQVSFVGGDPFLVPDLMRQALQHARGHGLQGTATTSAFWARSPARARAILEPLVQAGLGELVVSYDDAHAEFVPLRNVENAVAAAREFSLRLYVAVTLDAGARIDAAYLRRLLHIAEGDPRETVYEVLVNATGRAADNAAADAATARRADSRVYRGACHSALQNIQVTHTGQILPCCGVLPHDARMVIGDVSRGDRVDEAVAAAYQDPLWSWIALEGPVQVLVQATAGSAQPLAATDFDGICSACSRLFGSPELLAAARAAAQRKRADLGVHTSVLAALGLWRPPQPAAASPPAATAAAATAAAPPSPAAAQAAGTATV